MRSRNIEKQNTEKQNTENREYAICECLYKKCTIHETKNQSDTYDYHLNQAIAKSLESYRNEKHVDR